MDKISPSPATFITIIIIFANAVKFAILVQKKIVDKNFLQMSTGSENKSIEIQVNSAVSTLLDIISSIIIMLMNIVIIVTNT